MNKEYETGEKIQYQLLDKRGRAHWFDGVIHGVRRYEEGGFITHVTYLVDTGRDVHTSEHVYNPRDVEINKRVNAAMRNSKKVGEKRLDEIVTKVEAISQHSDLPDSELLTEVIRQPEQLELPAEHIRSV